MKSIPPLGTQKIPVDYNTKSELCSSHLHYDMLPNDSQVGPLTSTFLNIFSLFRTILTALTTDTFGKPKHRREYVYKMLY
jgi:hypothetical protein